MRLYAGRLGCLEELLGVRRLIDNPPAERQRAIADARGLAEVVPALGAAFAAADAEAALAY
jgi:hypothetical protein